MRRTLGFVFELVAGTAKAGACGVASLDHEIGDDAVKDCAVIQAVFAFLAADGMRPFAFAFGEFDKVGDCFGRFLSKETTDDRSFRGVEDSV